MVHIKASASATIDAPPNQVYAILADYRNGHPQILPEKYFSDLTVERGGIETGTLIRFLFSAFGQSRIICAEVSEPEPGRVLAETDLDPGAATTFIVEPINAGKAASVSITTAWTKPGISGFIERLTAPPLLRRIYAEELQKLTAHAEKTD